MRLASLDIAVLMQRRRVKHPWADDAWSAVGVVRNHGQLPPVQQLESAPDQEYYLVSGLELGLYPDENDGYYENWVAPEPKVFVMWRMEEGRAVPVLASVSYVEGTRMFDSGERADGVPMPGDIHAWLGEYLAAHYQPMERKGRQHG
ncbi:DUF3305 domain-containing protein [Oxalobacteraceae bacterium OM1]|nr:DUF3305 domain-containing protein [Oxalobacteraceae bacterium OM1]